ncbi:MAG: hypothetical protein H9535_08115 [Ignavibacteria bacterium]|nr:hypothetical protein [Ignavibacteria bacterium]
MIPRESIRSLWALSIPELTKSIIAIGATIENLIGDWKMTWLKKRMKSSKKVSEWK